MAIRELPVERLDDVRGLRDALRSHHAQLPTPPGFVPRDEESSWQDWRAGAAEGLEDGTAAILVSEADDGTFDGFAHVVELPPAARAVLEPTGPHGELRVLVVAESARGRGVGAALTDAASDWLRARGVVAMQILVRASNDDARRFYARRGAVDFYVATVTDLASASAARPDQRSRNQR